MIITFVSECQKNSLKHTRIVLDAYAHRIGQRAWQAILTEQGLQAVRSRLSKTARKTTAVACHRSHGTRRTELLWIVGNRRMFDEQGHVPTNHTSQNILRSSDENDWQYLNLMKAIVAIAGLFHDFGKSWLPFQAMLQSSSKSKSQRQDPVRHEWISLLLFQAFMSDRADEEWLQHLSLLSATASDARRSLVEDIIGKALARNLECSNPLRNNSSLLVQWIGWLIVSHHRLPRYDAKEFSADYLYDEINIWKRLEVGCGYEKEATAVDLKAYWKFPHGLPIFSDAWCRDASRWGRKLGEELRLLGANRQAEAIQSQRLILTLSRMALMLGDHEYSSKDEDITWRGSLQLFANTYRSDREGSANRKAIKKGELRQRLDEHLIRVTEACLKVVHLLPRIETKLPLAQNLRAIRKPSPQAFAWQNRAVSELKRYQQEQRLDESGFFAINMASTGMGKTIANAKIMDAISGRGLRYSLALGLRTLTLQTGDEYRKKLKLDDTELAVMIGSAAVRVLHEQRNNNSNDATADEKSLEEAGSESLQSLSYGYEFASDDIINDEAIGTITSDRKAKQLLNSPVLVCTIDHLMPATEGTRGGRQILPMLRLLSADLVLDEVDDYDHGDMAAVSRLVHLTGMLGRKVMISSATIAPAIAEGLFQAYQEGWRQFARFRNRSQVITSFWVDEFSAIPVRISGEGDFQESHVKFIDQRVRSLQQTSVALRRAVVSSVVATDNTKLDEQWFEQISKNAFELHDQHSQFNTETGKRVSIGIIRVANVNPCIDLTRYLLRCDLPRDVDIRVMAYHARQVQLIRSEQERHLDQVLNRKNERDPFSNPILVQHLRSTDKPNVLFIVVATPVAEVGRDHDYDWAIVEPSSMRSIIQMAGRVMRHRSARAESNSPNIVLPELNFKAFTTGSSVVFEYPGFEGGQSSRGGGYRLHSKNLCDIIDTAAIAERLDATARITCSADLKPEDKLVDLEHQVLRNILIAPDFRPAFVKGWNTCAYYLTDVSQRASPFRKTAEDSSYKLHITDEDELIFRYPDPSVERSSDLISKSISHLHFGELPENQTKRLWLSIDYQEQIARQQQILGMSKKSVCSFLGELRLIDREGQDPFIWHPALGARRGNVYP